MKLISYNNITYINVITSNENFWYSTALGEKIPVRQIAQALLLKDNLVLDCATLCAKIASKTCCNNSLLSNSGNCLSTLGNSCIVHA